MNDINLFKDAAAYYLRLSQIQTQLKADKTSNRYSLSKGQAYSRELEELKTKVGALKSKINTISSPSERAFTEKTVKSSESSYDRIAKKIEKYNRRTKSLSLLTGKMWVRHMWTAPIQPGTPFSFSQLQDENGNRLKQLGNYVPVATDSEEISALLREKLKMGTLYLPSSVVKSEQPSRFFCAGKEIVLSPAQNPTQVRLYGETAGSFADALKDLAAYRELNSPKVGFLSELEHLSAQGTMKKVMIGDLPVFVSSNDLSELDGSLVPLAKLPEHIPAFYFEIDMNEQEMKIEVELAGLVKKDTISIFLYRAPRSPGGFLIQYDRDTKPLSQLGHELPESKKQSEEVMELSGEEVKNLALLSESDFAREKSLQDEDTFYEREGQVLTVISLPSFPAPGVSIKADDFDFSRTGSSLQLTTRQWPIIQTTETPTGQIIKTTSYVSGTTYMLTLRVPKIQKNIEK